MRYCLNSFTSEAVYNFKWSLDHAASHGVRHFAIDVSTNMGGNDSVVMYMMAVLTNKNKNTNYYTFRTLHTVNNIVR